MSFTGLKYDTQAFAHDLRESSGILDYKMNTPLQCEECLSGDPSVRVQRAGASTSSSTSMVDIDSELMNITRKLSHVPEEKYLPKFDNEGSIITEEPKDHKKDCDLPVTEYTLLSNPSSNLRGTGWNRWEKLCEDPQVNLELPFEWNINTNILVRDNHRPCLNTPDDSTKIFPKVSGFVEEPPVYEFDEVPTEPVSVQWQKLNNVKKY
jgi:hypothetical protein